MLLPRNMIGNNTTYPTILAIDSTTGPCSVSVWKDGGIAAYREERAASLQSKRLVVMVEEALEQSNVVYSGLSAIACTVGPGSFTGIRIGLASARGIGFAAKIPVLGFSALEALAFGALREQPDTPVLAYLNAGKGEIAYQYFGPGLKPLSPPELGKKESIMAGLPKNTLMLGSEKPGDPTHPRADWLAGLAATHPEHAVEPVPFYIRPPDAKLPQNCLA
jgi:tRNA threonylcarbamoyladenosine biosynthesis protein TsaB